MKTALIALTAVVVLGPSLAKAQDDIYRNYPYYGGYGGYGYYSSTAGEGYARGLADVIRSHGIYNQLSADAATRLEDARRQRIENYQQAVGTYLQVRDQARARLAAQRAPRHERTLRWLQQRERYRPPRWGDDQLNRNGEINWPDVLKDEAFAKQRETLQVHFVESALLGGIVSIDACRDVQSAADQMLQTLKQRIDDIRPRDSILARRFIEGLVAEISMPRSES
ncbi:MAG: hypothetical protein ACC628_14300 [Pirellulaceae bacterium]